MKKKRYGFSLKDMVKFYTRFSIPWWMYIVSLVLGLIYAEGLIQAAKLTISFNKGELYNSVVIGYAVLTVLNSVISSAENIFSGCASLRVTYRARQMVWEKILRLPQSEIDRRQPSALISGVTNDVATASDVLTMVFLFFSSAYSFVRACVELFKYNASLASYMLVLIPIAILVFTVVGRTQHEAEKRTYSSLREMTEFFSEHISAAKNVKSQAMEDREEAEDLAAIDRRFKAAIYAAFVYVIQTTCFSMYRNIGVVMIAVFGSDMIRKGQMESTGINDFNTYMEQVHQYTSEVLTHYETVRGAQGSLEYVGEMLEGPQEELDQGAEAPSGEKAADLALEHVSFGYDPAVPVLQDLSVTIPGGKVTAVIGSNGSGKSTLLKLLQGIYSPDSGTIRMGGVDVSTIAPHALRRQFGYILQNNPLFSGTVRDNIVYGAADEPERGQEEDLLRAAQLADADGFIRELPEGYDTEVGEAGKLLSGGQRQRVAIARTLMTNPTYLLMDEAGASLDHKSDASIFRSVREAMKGRTVVVVAHDMRSVVEADYTIVLDHGRLEAAGTHAQLLRSSPTYRGYLEKQGFEIGEEVRA